MWVGASCAFWSSAAIIGYTYIGYPLSIYLLSRLRPRAIQRGPAATPTVSIVLAAHDEEATIAAKLDNLLALSYPAEQLQIVVVSDGSTDRTAQVVAGYADQRVLLVELPAARGKAVAINAAMERATGELVAFCDTRQRVAPDALQRLTALFADPRVGAASGELMLPSAAGPGVYWRYEKLIREAESRVDSVVGATGAWYVIRRELFRPLPEGTLLDDVYTPMQIALAGYRVLFEPQAKVFDREADLAGEFSRKARTLAGNFQLATQLPELLHPMRNRLFWQFASHKLLRLACPFALGTLLGANLALVATFAPPWPFYVATLGLQLAAYALAAYAGAVPDAGRLPRICQTFVTLNAAAVVGLFRYLRGDLSWTTARKQDLTHA